MQSDYFMNSLHSLKSNQRKKKNKLSGRLQFTCIINLPPELAFLPVENIISFPLAQPSRKYVREKEKERGREKQTERESINPHN